MDRQTPKYFLFIKRVSPGLVNIDIFIRIKKSCGQLGSSNSPVEKRNGHAGAIIQSGSDLVSTKDLFESSIMISTMAVRTVYVDVFNLVSLPIFPVLEIPESIGCFRLRVVLFHWIEYSVANGCLHF